MKRIEIYFNSDFFTLSKIFSRYSLVQCAFPSLGKPNTQLFASSSDLFTWMTALCLKKLYFIIAKVFSIVTQIISISNRTEWSPIWSIIIYIRVINKIGRPRSLSLICLISSMITDQIGRL